VPPVAPTAPADPERPADAALVDELIRIGREAGLTAVGVAPADPFLGARAVLEQRRADGLAGTMQFTYRNPERSTTPRATLPSARALVVAALGYRTPDPAQPSDGRPHARVARYARLDRYASLREGLEALATHLRAIGWRAMVVADDNALVDREAAYRAGLGWYGKNANVLLPGEGSWFVLGSVLTDAPLPARAEPVADGCGSCRRCLDGCPTGAIVAPGVVDARRCLAWLVQAEGAFPEEHREALGDRLYGCDDCQEVCPPNRALDRTAPLVATTDDAERHDRDAWVSVLDLLAADDAELLDRHGRWYIPRRDPRYLRRNALVVLGNVGDATDPEVVQAIDRYRAGDDELLREHATWAATRLAERAHDRGAPR
jgi:epoxyqueuosine reductase